MPPSHRPDADRLRHDDLSDPAPPMIPLRPARAELERLRHVGGVTVHPPFLVTPGRLGKWALKKQNARLGCAIG